MTHSSSKTRRKISRRVVAVVLVLNCLVMALAGIILRQSYLEYQARTAIHAANLAALLERNVFATLDKIDFALKNLAEEFQDNSLTMDALQKDMIHDQALLPEIHSMVLVDPDGKVLVSSEPSVPAPDQDNLRPVLDDHRDHSDKELRISAPFRLPGKDQEPVWVLDLSHRLNTPEGQFRGVISARLELAHFTRQFAGLNLGAHGAVALRDAALAVVARYPETVSGGQTAVGNSSVSRELVDAVRASPDGGNYRAVVSIDKVERSLSYRRIKPYPLYVVVGIAAADSLTQWGGDALRVIGMVLLFLLVTIGAGWWLQAGMRQKADALSETRRVSAELAAILSNVPFGLLITSQQRIILRANQKMLELFGISAPIEGCSTRVLYPTDDLFERLGAEAYPVVRAGQTYQTILPMQRHDGGSFTCKLTGRMINPDNPALGYVWVFENVTEQRAAEMALRVSEERIRLLVNSVTDYAIIRLNAAGEVMSWNSGAESVFGYTESEMMGQSIRNLYLGGLVVQTNRSGDPLVLAARDGRFLYDGPRKRKDGRAIWSSEAINAVYDADGAVQGFALVARDQTQRRQADLDLQSSTQRLRLLFETAAEGIYGVDDQNRILFANRAAAELLGWPSAEAMVGTSAHGILGHLLSDGTPCDEESCGIRQTLLDGQMRRVRTEYFCGVNGHKMPVEYTVGAAIVEGFPVGAVVIFRDISDRVDREYEIERLLAFQRTILEGAGNAMIAADLNGVITLFNPAAERLLGYDRRDVIGKMTLEAFHDREELDSRLPLLPTQEPAARYQTLFSSCTGEEAQSGEWVYIRQNGSSVPVLLSLTCMRDGSGKPTGVLEVAQDISRIKELEEILQRSNSELEHFAYVASHDLREPLRMISGFLGLLDRRLGPTLGNDEKSFIGFAVDGAKRMDRMIQDLLSYSRIGRKSDPKEMVDLNDILARVLRTLQDVVTETAAVIVLPEQPLPVLYASPTEMERLLQNLIANALKFRQPDRVPEVRILCRDGGKDWQIGISDNGIGIDERQSERLFHLFQRLVHRDQYDGTGIGLASCRKIAEHHGGSIRVQSRLGEGSSFWVSLPKSGR